jgi:2-phospho-L-lactate guanylyltransferase (CobY/MobA/RfbA family)
MAGSRLDELRKGINEGRARADSLAAATFGSVASAASSVANEIPPQVREAARSVVENNVILSPAKEHAIAQNLAPGKLTPEELRMAVRAMIRGHQDKPSSQVAMASNDLPLVQRTPAAPASTAPSNIRG